MKKFTLSAMVILTFLLMSTISVYAQILPVNWTGDIDIDTYQETSVIHGGSSSCKIVVNTGTQANCDLTSAVPINVTAGNTYTFSFWAYTSEFVRIRAVFIWVGASTTYSANYAGPATGGWVQFTFSDVVPAGATAVSLGLRSYDVTGFSAPETQYVDDVTFESPTGTSLTVANGGFESWPAANSIASAHAISSTAMDVVYGTNMSSVSAASYSLSGSAAVTFSGATIDGSDATIVHLTGASPSMAGDNILDNIVDNANATNFSFYAGITPLSYTNTTNPSGIIDNAHLATFTGIVSANDAFNNVWVSDASTAYHGVMVYNAGFQALVAVGDEIIFYASRDVYNNLTELINPVVVSILSTGNTPNGPADIGGSDIAETVPVNTDPGEKWEGQLVKIEDFTVESYVASDYRCSWSDGTNTHYFHIGDNVVYQLTGITLNIGETYNAITGVADWYNSGPYYRINPREQADILASTATARIVGSMQGWNTTDPAYVMNMNANGLYELTKSLDAGDHLYKVLEGDAWTDPNYPGNDQHVILASTTSVTWKTNINADLVTHMLPVMAGDFLTAIGGSNWDPSELMGEMTDPEGDDIFTLVLTIPAGNYQGKVTLNHNWDQSTGGNVSFITDGVNPTTFTYDYPNNSTTISGPPPPTALITFIVNDATGKNYDGFALKGSWDANGQYDPSWGGGIEHSDFYDDGSNGDAVAGDNIWTCQQDLVVDGGSNTWEWGVNDTEGNWIAGNWTFTVATVSAQTLTWTVPTTPALVINEIMYNSPGSDEEWVELYNNTNQPISLENWKLLDNDASHTPILFPAGYTVAAFGYFTIEVATSGAFPFTPDYDGSGNFNFTNTTDVVRLYNANGILIDIVNFEDSSPWPSDPDGGGPSLSLFSPGLDNSLGENWRSSHEDGGTPGAINFPINIVAPNGGETIEQGTTFDITWTVEGWDGDINIDLIRDGQDPVLLVSNLPVSAQSFTWSVFSTVDPATDYKILISETAGGNPYDESDDYFSITAQVIVPEIVITEIMYNPPESGNDSLEFIELYNNGDDAIDLTGYIFSKGVDFIFPAMTILPESYLLVSINSAAMLSTFGVTAEQWTGGALSNSGEELELQDALGNVVDYVSFSDALPWDTLADGYGPSLTLCNPNTDNSVAENWTHSIHYVGVNAAGDSIWATPGMGCDNSIIVDFEGTPTTVGIGGSVMFTDLSFGNVTQWIWTFDGGTPATWDGKTPPEIMYDAEGSYDVTLSITDGVNVAELTKMDYINVIDLPAPTNLQAEVGSFDDVTLTWNGTVSQGFSDDFETYENFVIDFAPWVNLDVDGSPTYGMTGIDWPNVYSEQSFIIFNPSQTTPAVTDIIPHSGDKLAACFAATAPPNNDWLITPEVNIADGFMLKFWAKSYTDEYGLERFKVGVSTTGLNPSDFTIISAGSYVEAPVADWAEFSYDLSAYAGQNVYVGIQCVSNDAFILLVDDVTIGATKSTIAYNPTQPVIGKAIKNISFTTQPNSHPAVSVNSSRGVAAELLGFNVYRDDVQINAALVTETTYNDPIPAIGTHDYYVTSVYTEGESGPSNVVTILITGISDNQSEAVTVYPNPTDGRFTINMPGIVDATIMVTDITGKVVYNESAVSGSEINLTGLDKGLYFVRIQDQISKQSFVKKLLVY
ncbi:MAG: hypothetical protein A2W85_11775 [Bacteroidetes bacterium GWF2_41_31]|nr:MAG: hypothetical protein A2W85_11775 [Bacteroidetes bacterium GWF2_41_31]